MRTIKVGHLIAWLLLLAAVSTTICFPKAVWATQDEDDGQVIIREVPVMPDGMDDYLKPASDDDSEAGGLQWYENNRSVLANHDIFVDVLRSIGWGLIRLLCLLANVTESLYDKTFGLIDITKYPQVDQLLIYLRPVLAALTVLCLMGLGAMLMFKHVKPQLVRHILLGILAVSCSGWIFSTANGLVTSFKDGMLGGASNANQSYTLVNDNIIDLVRVDREIGIESMDYRHGGGLLYGVGAGNDAELGLVDINETLNWRSQTKGMDLYGWSAAFNNRVKYRAVLDSAGALIAVENSDGLTSANIGNQFYYRYSFDFFSCALQLVSLTLLFCALAYKNVRIAYELVVSRILAYMYAADVSSGERLKNVLLFVRDTYITLAISVLCIKLYAIFTGAITALGVTGLGKGLVSLFIAYAVIDGPNLVERLLGMDAGLKSSFARGAAMLGAARGVARGAGAAAKGMKGLLNANADRRWQRADASRQDNREGGAHTSTSGQGQAGTGVDTDFMNDRSGNDRNGGSDRRHTATRDSGGAMPYAAAFSGNDDEEDTAPAEDRKRDAAAAERGSGAAPATGRTADLNNGQKPDFSRTAEPQAQPRPVNPAFREAVRRLSPGATAGAQERKDFNRQVNAIVRGKKHRAIQPAPDAPDYQKRNYDKALELEQAYRAYKPEKEKGGADNNGR